MSPHDSFDAHGYVLVKGLLDRSAIDALAALVNPILAQWLRENRDAYIEQRLVNMHSLTSRHYFQENPQERVLFFERLASVELVTLIRDMFGDQIYFHNTQLFFNPFKNRRLPYWHRDLQYSPVPDAEQAIEQSTMCNFHVRVPLLPEKGVELIPGTHKRWDTELEKDVRFEKNGRSNNESLPGAVLIDAEPGDVLVFDAQMIHRGNYALNRKRKALDLCVGKPHRFTNVFFDPEVLPTPDEIAGIPNNAWYKLAQSLGSSS